MNQETSNADGAAVACSAWLAVRPFRVNDVGFVITDCPLRFSEVDKDGHFMCPNCGRLGQRMVEASPEQCGLTANAQDQRDGCLARGLRKQDS